MPTWKQEMERQARYVRRIRPDAYTMPLPEDKPEPATCQCGKAVIQPGEQQWTQRRTTGTIIHRRSPKRCT